MPQDEPTCIPPPTDYTPKPRQLVKYRDRGGHQGKGRERGEKITYCRQAQEPSSVKKMKNQPTDRFHRNEDDDYFAHVQDEEDEEKTTAGSQENQDEDDPLDAYMKSLGGEPEVSHEVDDEAVLTAKPDVKAGSEESENSVKKRAIRLDIDGTDDLEESYYKYVEKSTNKKSCDLDDYDDRQDSVEYDPDGNVVSVRKTRRDVDPLPSIDHSTITYKDFNKLFYQEHSEIMKLSKEQSDELRAKLDIKVSGEDPPKPVCSFAHFRFDEQLMKVIRRSDFTQPTPIQAQAIPAALLGRNIIGVAMTGSGKTAAYLWPMIIHIMGQPDLKKGDGPIGLVLVPTRELALQVYGEAKKFASSYKIAVVCAYGGGSKYEQSMDLEAGAEIVIATPGRIIDLIKMDVTNLRRVTYLVLDEADRFFDMGFEAQVRSICDHVRPDRQTLLFSATFKEKIEQLARTVTDNPIKIVQKAIGEVNEDVTQHVIVLSASSKKWDWLVEKLVELQSAGSVLIFVTRIINSEELHKNLKEHGVDALLLHGDMEQSERNRVITAFKRKEKDVMIATDVAARGLDISHIRTVINFDVARDIDTHIHRVGRTGRAGLKGDAYTLLTDKDKEFAGHLVKSLESSQQATTKELVNLAMQSYNFRKSRNMQSNRSNHGARGAQKSDIGTRNHHHNRYASPSSSSGHSHRYRKNIDRQPDDRLSRGYSSNPSHNYDGHTSYDRGHYEQESDRKRSRWH